MLWVINRAVCAEGQLNGPASGRMNGMHDNPLAHPYPNQSLDAGSPMHQPGQQQACHSSSLLIAPLANCQ